MAENKYYIYFIVARDSTFQCVITGIDMEEANTKFFQRYQKESILEMQVQELRFNADGVADISFDD